MTPIPLYLATTNPGKLRDFAHALTPGFTLEPLPGLAGMPEPEETADTFEGNARLKAMAYSLAAPGMYVLSDDSGLEVDALGGAPGVRSARYADDLGFETHSSLPKDARNNACLQAQMLTHCGAATARYRCSLALALDGRILLTAEGTVEGEILAQPRGSGGFGYDPLFLLTDLSQTMAEVDMTARQQHSHRARALTALLASISRADLEAGRNVRASALMAIAPVVVLSIGLAGLIFSLAFTVLGEPVAGLAVDRPHLIQYESYACAAFAFSLWAALRARQSRSALIACGIISALLLTNSLVCFFPMLWRFGLSPAYQALPQLGFSIPFLVLAALGLGGTIRALRVRSWHDIAQT